MKITFVLPFLGLSGGVKVAVEYAEELAKRGHTVHLVYPAVFPFPGTTIKGRLYRMAYTIRNMLIGGRIPWKTMLPVQRILCVSEKRVPDADVIIATAWPNVFHIDKLSPKKGAKVYFIQHYETWGGRKNSVDKAWKAPMHKIVISTWLQELGRRKLGVSSDVVFNGLRLKNFTCGNRNPHRGVKRIGMLVHPAEWKGTSDGLKALEIVHKKYPNIEYVFYGRFKDKRVPDWATQEINLGTRELHDYFCATDLFVHPAHLEGWGLMPLEAMAAGCAVAITDSKGQRDYAKHDHNALVSPPKKPEQLAGNILRLIEEPETRQRLIKEGLKTAENFTVEKSVDAFEKLCLRYVRRDGAHR